MKTECTKSYRSFQVLGKRTIVADFSGGTITSDGGALLLREVEQRTIIYEERTQSPQKPTNDSYFQPYLKILFEYYWNYG